MEKASNDSKQSFSLMWCGPAAGEMMPPPPPHWLCMEKSKTCMKIGLMDLQEVFFTAQIQAGLILGHF